MLRIVYLTCVAALVLVMVLALPAAAQTDAVDITEAVPSVNYFDFFVVKGGYIAFGLIALSIVFLMSAVLLTEIELRSSVVVALARNATPVRPSVSHEAHNQLGVANISDLSHQSPRLSHPSQLNKPLSFLSE